MHAAPHWKRYVWHMVFAMAVLLMAVAAWYMNTSRQQRDQVLVDAQAVSTRLHGLRHQVEAARARVALVEQSQGFLLDVERAGVRPVWWGERRLGLRQQRMARGELDELLRGLIRTPHRLFGAGSFDLSVTHSEEGLFTQPGAAGNPVQVTVQGTQLFSTREDRS